MGAVETGAQSRVRALDLAAHDRPLNVLCLGAHSDDIEIGAGGAILSLADRFRSLSITWVVLSADGQRAAEARLGAKLFFPEAEVQLHEFADARFPMHLDSLKDVFVDLGRQVSPDVIFTHAEHDRHQDHGVVNRLTWQTFRDHLIFEYEVPKFDADLVTPNFYFELAAEVAEAKVRHLEAAFGSQAAKPWFDSAAFFGLMRIRGIECRSASGFAEGFHVRKAVIA
jgi:LmbE family N-acetylglucosaminyl deacetylase